MSDENTRISKTNYYLDIAQTVSTRTTCLRKKYGSIIVKDDSIIATGYVGAPRGRKNCTDIGFCIRDHLQVPRGERYEICRSVHSEMNAIIHAPRDQMLDATMYIVGVDAKTGGLIPDIDSCQMCKRMIINAGIRDVVMRVTAGEYRTVDVRDWVEDDDSLGKIGY
jgi:dCMP deaminase